jgi:hypothetical protein
LTKKGFVRNDYLDPEITAGCQKPCNIQSDAVCNKNTETGNFVCRGAWDMACGKIAIHSSLIEQNYTQEAANINFNLSYQFRDNFLKNHNVGQEYIQMYYELSDFLVDKYTLSIMLKTALTLGDCNIIMTKLLNPTTYGNDIAITESQKNMLLDLINDYKALSNNQIYTTKLTRVETDLNNYAGLTVSNLIQQLQ